MTTQELAEIVRYQMKLKKMTQYELAKAAGISRVILNRFLNGKTNLRLDAVLAVMQVLEIEIQKPQHFDELKTKFGDLLERVL